MTSELFHRDVQAFDPTRPIEESVTPPKSWYTDPDFYRHEVARVFQRSWIPVGRVDAVQFPGDYFTVEVAGNPCVIVRGDDGKLYAHHNVCRHKGAIVAHQEDEGQHSCDLFQCPYHGWQYHLDGRLKKAPMLGQQRNFDRTAEGLQPMGVETWGPFVFIDMDAAMGGRDNPRDLHADVAPLEAALRGLRFDQLKFHRRYVYDMNCNWKVFADNSLDGGYHVMYAHQSLASGLEMQQFETEIFERTSVQVCDTKGHDSRLGERVVYAYLFPNLFINRYGDMMDTNIVLPMGVDRCRVIFDFYFDYEKLESWESRQKIRKSVASSHSIQQEDVEICESAQRGMQSMSWTSGRYSSTLERAVYAFHQLLHEELLIESPL
ncbi:MAG: SRPBCC family protein [Planctomycetota bacterium]